MNPTVHQGSSTPQDETVNVFSPSQDVSQAYLQAPIISDNEDDITTTEELPPNSHFHDNDTQSEDNDNESQGTTDSVTRFLQGIPAGPWDYYTDPEEYMTQQNLDTTTTASDSDSDDDSSYSDHSVSDSTPILNMSEILSHSSNDDHDSASDSSPSTGSMPSLIPRREQEDSSVDHDS